jgi:hypothetical protein
MVVAACYRPTVADKTTTADLRKSYEHILEKRQHPFSVIIVSDLNYPGLDWSLTNKDGTQHVALHNESNDFIDDFGFTNHIPEPTAGESL